MAEKKYPEYVTTDSDMWNSADEAYFFVIKKKAKRLTSIITPIIDNALETGMLREATKEEIDDYLLNEDIEKRLREGRFNVGKTYDETLNNYNEWKEVYEKNNSKKINDKKVKSKKEEIETTGTIKELNDDKNSKVIKSDKNTPELTKTLSPTENALKQKATIRSDNM